VTRLSCRAVVRPGQEAIEFRGVEGNCDGDQRMKRVFNLASMPEEAKFLGMLAVPTCPQLHLKIPATSITQTGQSKMHV